jgi:hypothetical protein
MFGLASGQRRTRGTEAPGHHCASTPRRVKPGVKLGVGPEKALAEHAGFDQAAAAGSYGKLDRK